MRHAIIGSCAAIALTIAQFAFAEEPKKDAAETVGEGNASRWLDFYRRERGEHWDSNPHTEAPGSPPSPAERRDRPRSIRYPGRTNASGDLHLHCYLKESK